MTLCASLEKTQSLCHSVVAKGCPERTTALISAQPCLQLLVRPMAHRWTWKYRQTQSQRLIQFQYWSTLDKAFLNTDCVRVTVIGIAMWDLVYWSGLFDGSIHHSDMFQTATIFYVSFVLLLISAQMILFVSRGHLQKSFRDVSVPEPLVLITVHPGMHPWSFQHQHLWMEHQHQQMHQWR